MTLSITEKYRPKTIDEIVLPNETFRLKLKEWIDAKRISNHILLYGLAGLGKSSTINVLINEMGLTDYIKMNVSDKTSIDDMRSIIEYASVPPLTNNFKLVILEEFERASKASQASLKYVLDNYGSWCIFIFTTNDISKINDAIISRTQQYEFVSLPYNDFVERVATVLMNEKITISNNEQILKYIDTFYPDLRACLTAIEQNTISNVLQDLKTDSLYSVDKFNDIIESSKTKTIMDTKKLIGQTMSDNDYELLYQYMYNHLELLTTDMNKWDSIIVKIAEYLYKHQSVAYPCINLVACLIEVSQIIK